MRAPTGLKHDWKTYPFTKLTLTCCARCMIVQNDNNKDRDNCPGVVKLRPFEKIEEATG